MKFVCLSGAGSRWVRTKFLHMIAIILTRVASHAQVPVAIFGELQMVLSGHMTVRTLNVSLGVLLQSIRDPVGPLTRSDVAGSA